MPSWKPPLTPELIERLRNNPPLFRAHAANTTEEVEEPEEPPRFLASYVDDELVSLRGTLGSGSNCGEEDRKLEEVRLLRIAETFAFRDLLAAVGEFHVDADGSPADGEDVIEAMYIQERLEAGDMFEGTSLAAWATSMREASPKATPKGYTTAPFAYGYWVANEMVFALLLTRHGREVFRPSLMGQLVEQICLLVLLDQRSVGARFARDPLQIVEDWRADLRLSAAYRPGGGMGAPVAFLRTQFRFHLDRENRRIGELTVSRRRIRQLRQDGRIGRDANPSQEELLGLMAESVARMTHAPPPNFLTSATLRDVLMQRQDEGTLAVDLAKSWAGRWSAAEELLDATLSPAILEWLEQSPSARSPLPAGVLAPDIALGRRSVDALVKEYEAARETQFTRDGRSRLIPVTEVDAIVRFANARARKATRRSLADPPP